MTEKYKILSNYVKDMSSETPDIETYLFVKDMISKYHLKFFLNKYFQYQQFVSSHLHI